MHGIFKSVMIGGFLVMSVCIGASDACDYSLTQISYDTCVKKAQILGSKFKRARYIRGIALTVSMLFLIYKVGPSLYDWLVSSAPTPAPAAPPVTAPRIGWGTWLWDSTKIVAQVCAQQIVANWLVSRIMVDQSPQAFMQKNISYKVHALEIQHALAEMHHDTMQSDDERVTFLIHEHLRMMVAKIGLLMTYLLNAAHDETQVQAALLDTYVKLTLDALNNEITAFNEAIAGDFVAATTHAERVLVDLLSSSIRYTLCTLSCGE